MRVTKPADVGICFFLTAALTVSSIFAPVSAFSLPADSGTLALCCCAAALFWSVCLHSRHSGLCCTIAAAAAAALLWKQRSALVGAIGAALAPISHWYSLAFGLPPLPLPASDGQQATLFLACLSLLPSGMTACTIRNGLPAWTALAVCAAGPVLALNILETVPATWTLLLFSAAGLLLLLTQPLRRLGSAAARRAVLPLTLSASLLAAALFLPAALGAAWRPAWADRLHTALSRCCTDSIAAVAASAETAEAVLSLPGGFDPAAPVDLSAVGPDRAIGRIVMQVHADRGGPLYLRGASLGVYTGASWTALPPPVYQSTGSRLFTAPLPTADHAEETITIRPPEQSRLLYCPYYPAQLPEGTQIADDACYRPGSDGEYTVARGAAPSSAPPARYAQFVRTHYLSIPSALQAQLDTLVRQAGLSSPGEVAAFVSSCGIYRRSVPCMPPEGDFVLSFLERGEGCCVHFASTAVLLLRSIDIPARYVSGYLVHAESGAWTDVTDRQAHAWVEYFTPEAGWTPMEVTPAAVAVQREAVPVAPAAPELSELPETASEAVGPQRAILWLLPAALLPAGLLSYPFRLLLRHHRFTRGEPNRRALAIWPHLLTLSGKAHTAPPPQAERLALRARFGSRPLTEADADALLGHVKLLQRQLRADRLARRLLHRWVRALF